MSIVDLHPEDLIDRLSRGHISEAERAIVEAHLAGCAVCRVERQARQDFGREMGEASALTHPALSLSTALQLGMPALAPPLARSRRSTRTRRRWLALLAAAAVMVTGVAGASIWSRMVSSRAEPAAPPTAPVRPASHATAKMTNLAPPVIDPPAELAVTAPDAPIAPTPTHPFGTATVSPARPLTSSRVASVDRNAERVAPESSPVAHAAVPAPVDQAASPATETAPSPTTAASLFATANGARRRGDGAHAIQLYRDLQQRFPRSDEARVSRATLARLLFDRGEPSAALSGFDQYLAHGGGAVLEEEALVGRALALQNLGRQADEIAAWNEVLKSYPSSIYSEHARARLAALIRH